MINIIHAPILFIGILSLFFSFVSILFKKRVYNKFKEAKKERYDYKPTVSVLLPVKDVDKNLGATLKSLLNQDYPKTKYDITILL
jgi:cellulose synthase/poly-beta-1,6-N-acetylglucosamine synthase-like glycosyltransferase